MAQQSPESEFWQRLASDEHSLLMHFVVGYEGAAEAYIRYLSSHAPVRAEILRLDAALTAGPPTDQVDPMVARLRELLDSPEVDPHWWRTVHAGPAIYACGEPKVKNVGADSLLRFLYVCNRSWASLEATTDPFVRRCDRCASNVVLCPTRSDAEAAAKLGQCIAVSAQKAGEVRADVTKMMTGRPDWRQLWAEALFEGE